MHGDPRDVAVSPKDLLHVVLLQLDRVETSHEDTRVDGQRVITAGVRPRLGYLGLHVTHLRSLMKDINAKLVPTGCNTLYVQLSKNSAELVSEQKIFKNLC